MEPPTPAKQISREITFSKDTRDRSFLKATLRYLGEMVGAELREEGKQARAITLKLRYADFTTITRRQTLPQPFDSDQTIFDIGVKLLYKALPGETQPVRLIGIGVSELVEGGADSWICWIDPPGGRSNLIEPSTEYARSTALPSSRWGGQ